MTHKQAIKLAEMGYPQTGQTDTYYTIEGYRLFSFRVGSQPTTDKARWDYCGPWYDNPTAEEVLKWIVNKLATDNSIYKSIGVTQGKDFVHISAGIYAHVEKTPFFGKKFETFSDAAFALVEWAWNNKLLEDK